MKNQFYSLRFNKSVLLFVVSVLTAFILSSTSSFAQIAMTRSSFTSAYTPISVSGGAIASTASGDDAFQAGIPIGFTFTYLGNNFTTLAVSTNGWLSFNAVTSYNASNSDLYATATPYNNMVAPWWDDLNTSSILYQTSGDPGSQVFTIQWVSISYWTGSSVTINYQVKLYEGTNVIELCYGSKSAGTPGTSESASIGIENSTGGENNFIDAVTGSRVIGNGMMSASGFPVRNFRFTPGAPSAIAGGSYNVGIGQAYPCLSEAIADINHRGISGPVTLLLTDAVYDETAANGGNIFPIILGNASSVSNTLTIQPVSGTANIRSPGSFGSGTIVRIVSNTSTTLFGSAQEPVIGLAGSDYVTIQNVNLGISGNVAVNGTKLDKGLAYVNASVIDGAQNNTFKNFTVTLLRTNTSALGFESRVPYTPSGILGANSGNKILDFTIKSVYQGIALNGNASFPDLNTEIGTTLCTNYNFIGDPLTANDIGNSSTATFGISAGNQSGFNFHHNIISNVSASTTTDGIIITTFQGTSSLHDNIINRVRNTSTSSTNGVSGLRLSHTTTGTHALRVYNNVIFALTSAYTSTATSTRVLKGIFVSGTGGATSQTYDFWNNSVSIDGSGSLNLSSACFEISTSTGPIYTIKNNIFLNATATQGTTAKHYVIVSNSGSVIGNTGSLAANNDLFISNDEGTSGFIGLNTAAPANLGPLATWQTAYGSQASGNLSLNPQFFNNNSDLHVSNISLNDAGDVLPAYITTDVSCNARTDKDLGAYNIVPCTTPVAGTSASSPAAICTGQSASLIETGASVDLGTTYQWHTATAIGGPYSPVAGGTGFVASTGTLTTGTYFYKFIATCSLTSLAVESTPFSLVVNPLPSVAVTPTTGLICGFLDKVKTPPNYALTASGANTYTWNPSTGLSASTGSAVTANPSASTTYTVVGTNTTTGCVNSATSVISVGPKISLTGTAAPADVCAGGTSNLNAVANHTQINYTVSSIPFAPIAIATSAGTVDGEVTNGGPSGDDAVTSALDIGFAFNFFGVNHTKFAISTNGNIQLGDGSGSTNNPSYSSAFTTTVLPSSGTPNNTIGAPWGDYNTGYPGGVNNNITWGVRGIAPDRQLIVSYNNVGSYPFGSNAQVTTEIILYETTNIIEVHVLSYLNGSASPGTTKTIGIENATGTQGYMATGRSQYTGEITTSEAWRFTPVIGDGPAISPAPAFSWSPNTFLSATNIANPVATGVNQTVNYTLTATSPEGCSASIPVQLRSGTLTANISSDDAVSCQGQNVTLTANVTNGAGPFTYLWSPGGETTQSINIAPTSLGANNYSVVVNGACPGGGATTSANFVQTVELTPTLNLNAGYSTLCSGSATPVTLTASGDGTSYAWSPSTGLDITTGATVHVSGIANSVNYTVVSTLGNCSATKTSFVKVPGRVYLDASANPDAICVGSTSLLTAATSTTANYVADIETASLVAESGVVTTLNNTTPVTAGNFNNGYWQVALPFNVSFFDQAYSNIYIGTNGYVSFPQGYTVAAATSIPSASSPNGAVFLAWRDWTLSASGSIKYFTSGSAPNRIFVVEYVNVPAAGGGGLLNGQIEIYENGNIYMVLVSVAPGIKTVGIESADGNDFRSYSTFNGQPFTISSPQLFRMTATGGQFTYAWSPSLSVFDATAQSTSTINLNTLPATFSILVTDSSGCTNSENLEIIEGTTMNVVVNTPDVTPCIGQPITISAQVFGGGAPYTYTWENNSGILPYTTSSFVVTPNLGSDTYFVTVTDQCTGIPAEGSVAINVLPLPTITVTPSAVATIGGALACGTDSVTLIASGSSINYVWSPATNLNKSTGSTVKSRPTTFNVPKTYTVVGTDANQCSNTTSINVLRAFSISLAASATPASVCNGANSQLLALATLNATNYDVNSIDYNGRYTGALATSGPALNDEGNITINLPFSFNFYGTGFNAVTIHANGQLLFGGSRTDADFAYSPPSSGIPTAGAPDNWFGYWSDLNVTTAGSITYDVIGSAPNRKLVVRFNAVPYYFSDPANTFQYELTETSNTMDVYITSNATSSGNTRELGIENSTGTVGLSPAGRNYGTWQATSEAWRFEFPNGGLTYLWTPSTFLTSTTIKNPIAQNVTSSQPYSVTVTSTDGCKATANTPVERSTLTVASITAPDLTVCQDTLIKLTANVTGGGQPYTYAWLEDGLPIGTNSSELTLPAGSAGNHTYSVTVTDICGSAPANNSIVVQVIARPPLAVTSSGGICGSGTATLTATGASTYTWSPAGSLLSSTGAVVTAAPAEATLYQVVGISTVTGCGATASIIQWVHLLPTVSATAVPNPILLNANTQLNAAVTQNSDYGYTVASIPYAPVTPTGTPVVLQTGGTVVTPLSAGSLDDGTWSNINLPAGFAFSYFGVTKTAISVSTNGFITFNGSSTENGCCSGQALPSATTPNDVIAMGWEDWNHTAGTLDYFTNGVAPNRKFVVRAQGIPRFGGTGAPTTAMIILNETANTIDIQITSIVTGSTDVTTLGIENSTGLKGYTVSGRNAVSGWTAANEGWQFAPITFGVPVFSYAWTPAIYLDNTTIQNPFASSVGAVTTYTVNVTNTTTGCNAAPAFIQVLAGVPLSVVVSGNNTLCFGQSTTLSSTVNGGGVPYYYKWTDGSNTIISEGFGATSLTVTPSASTDYILTITDVGNNTLASSPFHVTVNPLPDIAITPPGGSICNSTTGITLTASGNSSGYAWSPADGLSGTSGSIVTANPTVTTTYAILGTISATGCQNSTTVTVHKANLTAVASGPYNLCHGYDAQLNLAATRSNASYTVAPLAFSDRDLSPLSNFGPSGDEGNVTANLPFTFRYFGNSYTAVTIHVNGQILMGPGNTSADFAYSPPTAFPNTATPNNWVGFWADLNATGTDITWGVVGFSPNRKFIARWTNVNYWSASPAVSYQIELNESSDLIDLFVISNATASGNTRMIGLENSTGTLGTLAPGRSSGLWTASNEGWRFTPASGMTFSWSPTTGLTNPTLPNPVAQGVNANIIYTATATDPISGCSISDTTIVKIVADPRGDISGPVVACEGLVTNLTVNFTGFPPFVYSYTDGFSTFGPFTSATNSATLGVTPPGISGEVFTYSLLNVADKYCNIGSANGSHTLTVVPVPDLTGVTFTSDKPYNLVCSGDKITLSIDGVTDNTFGYQGQWKWYSGGCGTGSGGTLIASGVDKLKVSPTVNTTYYVRIEGGCNNSACLSLPVTVSTSNLNGNPTITYAPPIAYAGLTDSVVVAPIAGAYYYRWTNGGNSNVLFDGHPAPYTTTSNKVMVTFVSGATSGNGIGNYHLSFFAANGCSRSNNNTIQIRASVAAPAAINGPNVACVGQTRTYTVSAITGAKSYQWSFGSGNGTITGNGTSTVNVTFTSLPASLCVHGVSAFNSSGPDLCMNITTTILAPGAVTGDTLPCPSSSSVYSVSSVVGATSYVWSTTIPGATVVPIGNGSTATATFPAGTFTGTICAKANSGCTLSANTCLNIVNGTPAPIGSISGITTGLCNVTSVNFQVPSTGATTYTWGVPSGATIMFGQGTNSILVDFSGSFGGGNITVAATNACGTTNGSLPVSGAPTAPVITPNAPTACAGESVGYTASSPGATSYTWTVNPSEGSITIHSANYDFVIVDWIADGGQVSAVANNSCGSSALASVVTPAGSCRVGGNAVLVDALRALVFPNPSHGQITLQYNSPVNAEYLLKVTDLAGRNIVRETISGMQGLNRHELDLSNLAKGMYKLTMENVAGETIVMKVVIE